jgi:integrase
MLDNGRIGEKFNSRLTVGKRIYRIALPKRSFVEIEFDSISNKIRRSARCKRFLLPYTDPIDTLWFSRLRLGEAAELDWKAIYLRNAHGRIRRAARSRKIKKRVLSAVAIDQVYAITT